MVRGNLRGITSAFLVGILIALSASVFAATATGTFFYYGPVAGYKYKNQNKAISDSSGARANMAVYSDGSGNIPTGYMGAGAGLWNQYGSLVASTSMYYNQSSSSGISCYHLRRLAVKESMSVTVGGNFYLEAGKATRNTEKPSHALKT